MTNLFESGKINPSELLLSKIKICEISKPMDFVSGINGFLQLMGITMRISGHNRPRINKFGSQLDKEQKKNSNYYGI